MATGEATADQDILFEVRGSIGLVTLNRPRALNALTLAMCQAFDARLATWSADPQVRAVVVKGTGERAFCAGGDVRAIWEAGRKGEPLSADFFRAEYRLNRRIKRFPKPYVALIDGITMGGGVGVSVHGSHRIATERTLFAMPETGIGLFPDVGGGYFLPRLPGRIGLYLALSGVRLKAADCLYAGIATHHVAAAALPELEAALAEALADGGSGPAGADAHARVETVLGRFAGDPGPAPLAAHREAIDRCFAAESVEAILAALEAEGSDWARETLNILQSRSPLSLKVTFEQMRRGATMDFEEVMVMEYRLSQAFMAGHDFYEGIRAVVIEKDNAPMWDPPSLDAVTPQMVEACFAPLGDRDLTFDDDDALTPRSALAT
ncbi:MAG: enoyl-CoA hydratase/isomerase family protein [Alphaproteobacteria bacterium]|nr:MAG: enoyl-CoA hydratase/isomerase family protein [Alphaproteobacteria bacterium]